MMDSCQIVSGSELKRLYRYQKFALAGWGLSLILAGLLAISYGQVQAYRVAVVEVQQLRSDLLQIQEKQEAINATYIKAWSLQERTADALISWGEFNIEVRGLKEYNKNAVSYVPRTK